MSALFSSRIIKSFVIGFGAVVLSIGVSNAVHAATAAKTSSGVVCTIVGTASSDTLTGTARKDVICGLGGNDTINGLGGDDIVDGGNGNDKINGGTGSDKLYGGAGNDSASGEGGNDQLNGGDGTDTLRGDSGVDSLSGDSGNDSIGGGEGMDSLSGGLGNDKLSGDSGDDSIGGGSGDDTALGGEGNDRLVGDAGNDILKGEAGNDGMIGGSGSDNLSGANGSPAPNERNLCEKDVRDTVTYCGFDNAAPWIASAELSTTQVDSSTKAQTVQVTLKVTDELMGVSNVGCSIMFDGARMSLGFDQAVRISGDAIDGVYVCNVTIPVGGSTGRWGLNLDTKDRAGNMGLADQGNNGKWHSNLPEIMNQSPEHWITQIGAGDNKSPRITEPVFSKTQIDTSARSATFNLDVTITDDYSGVDTVNCGLRHNAVESFDIQIVVSKLSGTDKRGIWRCAATLPKNSGNGKWYLAVFVTDKSGKGYSVQGIPGSETSWSVDDVAEKYVQPNLDLGVNYITQIGAGDDELPTMTSISLDKTRVNTSSASQTVVATLNLVDVESGIRSVELRSFSPTTFAQNDGGCQSKSTNGSGNEVWTCNLTLPLGSQKGLHSFSITIYDKVGNRVTYDLNQETGKWRLMPLAFYSPYQIDNLDLGPTGVINTD